MELTCLRAVPRELHFGSVTKGVDNSRILAPAEQGLPKGHLSLALTNKEVAGRGCSRDS